MTTAILTDVATRSLIDGVASVHAGKAFHGFNPANGLALEPEFFAATEADVEAAVTAAVSAAPAYAALSNAARAQFLRTIADLLDANAAGLIERAHRETALPVPRLTGEVGRTSGQLRLFASVVEEGSWAMPRIDEADPTRTPPRPDIRSMLRPIGPVAVFGASNFPLAFSVAGGDTASALAAGNPVVVKAHPAHPATSALAGAVIAEAVHACGLPGGVFSLLFDDGYAVGAALVQHPAIRAVGFTGSSRGGRALMELAAKRDVPIPVYAEMGSTNPVFLLPGALAERAEALATGLHASFTLGGGQFCTKPGMVFAPASAATSFLPHLRTLTGAGPAFHLLTGGIAQVFGHGTGERSALVTAVGRNDDDGFAARTTLFETTYGEYAATPELSEELFGPSTLVIHCDTAKQLLEAARALEGHLTATVFGTDDDLATHAGLLQVLETKVGRVIVNAFPTGVEVCHAMVHGGPWPATSDGRSTSVGSQAIFRFARPVAYQGFPQSALPAALQDSNPLQLLRLVNGKWDLPESCAL